MTESFIERPTERKRERGREKSVIEGQDRKIRRGRKRVKSKKESLSLCEWVREGLRQRVYTWMRERDGERKRERERKSERELGVERKKCCWSVVN